MTWAMGRAVLGGGWCTIEGLDMDLNFFAKRRIWDDDFAKHVAWVCLGRFGWERLALASGNEGYDI
jgi:hypothetical protein